MGAKSGARAVTQFARSARDEFKVAHYPVLASLDRGNRFCLPLQRRLFNSEKPAMTAPAQERSAANNSEHPCDQS
jgi:hypothetical protein